MKMKMVKLTQGGSPDGLRIGWGSKVILPSGEEMPGVVGVEIPFCGPEDFWQAKITCLVELDEDFQVEADILAGPPSWWRRLLLKAARFRL